MAQYNSLKALFSDICDAIRERSWFTGDIKHVEIADAIRDVFANVVIGFSDKYVNALSTYNKPISELLLDIKNDAKNYNTVYDLTNCFNQTDVDEALIDDTVLVCDFALPVSSLQGFCKNSTIIAADFSGFNTKYVEDMSEAFYNCGVMAMDVSSWDTSNVKNMRSMFNYCSSLQSLNVSNWDTSNVIDMSNLFNGCNNLTKLDISNWDTSNVIDMGGMFSGCSSLTSINVSNWDTSNANTMSHMFSYCDNLSSIDVSNFDTSNVTDMSYMFKDCQKLTSMDISNFDVSKAKMLGMFAGCSSLTYLKIGNILEKSNDYSSIRLFMDGDTQNPQIDFDGHSFHGGFALSDIWKNVTTDVITNYEFFANSLGVANSNDQPTIQIHQNLYNALSSTSKALVTNKGYVLQSST